MECVINVGSTSPTSAGYWQDLRRPGWLRRVILLLRIDAGPLARPFTEDRLYFLVALPQHRDYVRCAEKDISKAVAAWKRYLKRLDQTREEFKKLGPLVNS